MKWFFKFLLRTLLVLFIVVNIITAFNAYKFTHYYNAGDITVKKDNEKNGWDKTKEILFGINAIKKANTIVADSSFSSIYFTTASHEKLEAWFLKTDGPAKGTVLMFHGHGSTKSAIMEESRAFRKLGYHTLLLDFRAHGNSGGNTTTIGYYEAEDVKLAYEYIKNKGEKNIVLWGISMGAATVTKAINDYGLQPSKVILEMPFGSLLNAAAGRIKMMGLPPQPLATLITFWGGVEHGFWAFDLKPTNYVKKIKCPVLLQWGKLDPRVTEAETDAVYKNIPTAKKLVVYNNAAHESLYVKAPALWNKEVSNFLSQ